MLEELADAYGTEWTTTKMFVNSGPEIVNDFWRDIIAISWPMSRKRNGSFASIPMVLIPLNRRYLSCWHGRTGRIPVIIDNTQSPPFPVMETSAELLYLLKFADKDDKFGFKDELERSECLQWLFFWHGSGAPYQGQTNHFGKFAKEKIPCE